MARLLDKQRALKLRKMGKSYSQIKTSLNISKSTLSYWLQGLPLTKKQISLLRDNNQVRIERYRETRLKKKESRLNLIYAEEEKKIFPLTKRDLFIAGLFLYWGEGSKTKNSEFEIANTDPAVLKFFIHWATKILKVEKIKIKAHLHLYSDMSILTETEFWSKILDIPNSQFRKPYIKRTLLKTINRGTFGHGTCTLKVSNARLTERILMGIKSVRNKFGP